MCKYRVCVWLCIDGHWGKLSLSSKVPTSSSLLGWTSPVFIYHPPPLIVWNSSPSESDVIFPIFLLPNCPIEATAWYAGSFLPGSGDSSQVVKSTSIMIHLHDTLLNTCAAHVLVWLHDIQPCWATTGAQHQQRGESGGTVTLAVYEWGVPRWRGVYGRPSQYNGRVGWCGYGVNDRDMGQQRHYGETLGVDPPWKGCLWRSVVDLYVWVGCLLC